MKDQTTSQGPIDAVNHALALAEHIQENGTIRVMVPLDVIPGDLMAAARGAKAQGKTIEEILGESIDTQVALEGLRADYDCACTKNR